MGDRTTVYIEVRKDDRDLLLELLGKVVRYGWEMPDEENINEHTIDFVFCECNYGWDTELNLLSQKNKCPPFSAFSGEGGDYEPERYVFVGGRLYSHVANREMDLIITVDKDHIDYDSWGYTQLFLEVEKEFQDYTKQYEKPV